MGTIFFTWWGPESMGGVVVHLPDFLMCAGWPHETAGISLGPEMQPHVGLGLCCGKPPLIDERKKKNYNIYF